MVDEKSVNRKMVKNHQRVALNSREGIMKSVTEKFS